MPTVIWATVVLFWMSLLQHDISCTRAALSLRLKPAVAAAVGDVLLVGIDRRNSAEKVQLAYNDPAGIVHHAP